MPVRKTILVQEQIYHVFNRGVAGQPIFASSKDYSRFLELVEYYRFVNIPASYSIFNKLSLEERSRAMDSLKYQNLLHVEILAFCLMPNHFHFLLKQISSNGIKNFLANIQNGYAKYFNMRTKRTGPLYQSTFKGVLISTDEQLLHVSRYIHLNPSTSYLVSIDKLLEYPWSSFTTYLSLTPAFSRFVNSHVIIDLIKGESKYKKFVFDQASYQRRLGDIKHLLLE